MIVASFLLLLLQADFPICTQVDHQNTPVVLFENNQFYVFWQDNRFFGTEFKYALFAARITKNGTVIDPQGKLIYSDSAAPILDAAYDGTNFLVVFRDPNC